MENLVTQDKEYYVNNFLKLNCACVAGRRILAKPILILAIISVIEDDIIRTNQFFWDKNMPTYKALKDAYENLYISFFPCEYLTPMFKPFFHLTHEKFWHHEIRNKDDIPKYATLKYLTTNLKYAYLDSELWNLLQDPTIREEFRQTIIDFYLRS